MQRLPWTLRFALWAMVCAVLLKSAVPLLASVSAERQGKRLVEVCTVYGVATIALDAQGKRAPASEHGAAHADTSCALGALVASALSAPPAPGFASQPPVAPPPRGDPASSHAPDATAAWLARLRHGPPAFA